MVPDSSKKLPNGENQQVRKTVAASIQIYEKVDLLSIQPYCNLGTLVVK